MGMKDLRSELKTNRRFESLPIRQLDKWFIYTILWNCHVVFGRVLTISPTIITLLIGNVGKGIFLTHRSLTPHWTGCYSISSKLRLLPVGSEYTGSVL